MYLQNKEIWTFNYVAINRRDGISKKVVVILKYVVLLWR